MFKEKYLIFQESPGKFPRRIEVAKNSAPDKVGVSPKQCRNTLAGDLGDKLSKTEKLNDDFFKVYPRGKFSYKERELRTETNCRGITLLRDVGLVFYKVVKGDTIGGIRQKLGKLPEFAYFKTLTHSKIKSFNIPPRLLQLGMWIPLPPAPDSKEKLTESSLMEYCGQAIDDLKKNERYGIKMTNLVASAGKGEIIEAMMTVARAESGGVLGEFADRRYENRHKAFSYTLFHVLMDDAGLKARRKLGMTEGQTLYPKNSAKLFLAFLFEKAGKKGVKKYFPLDKHFESFATFYNGDWEKRIPRYPDVLRKYYQCSAPMASLDKKRK